MNDGLNILPTAALDFVSLGALVHRIDPGVIPFRKATVCALHVSGGEFNTAANLADCFRLRTGVVSAMVNYPIGDMVAERVRARASSPSTNGSNTTASMVQTSRQSTVIAAMACARRWSSTIVVTRPPRN